MSPKKLLISIKPRFAAKIFDGTKTVELRRQLPKVENGDTLIVYESSPVMHITGTAQVKSVESDIPEKIWQRFKNGVGITKSEFDAYFEGASQAVAIRLEKPAPLPEPISLARLRNDYAIEPPQSFRYVTHIFHSQISTKLLAAA
jgi:predicted transcriptional regulator